MSPKLKVRLQKYKVENLTIEMIISEAKAATVCTMTLQKGSTSYAEVKLAEAEGAHTVMEGDDGITATR